jgi:methylated-DNA-[protein]-cysteine S-methyltransferase
MIHPTTMLLTHHAEMDSPLGRIRLGASDLGLSFVHFGDPNWAGPSSRESPAPTHPEHPVIALAIRELTAYFEGHLQVFTVPLAPRGTDFQHAVWAELRKIPYGDRRAYRDIAHALGRPTATRAVGAANGQNPIGIIQPCHRVLGADGSLTGFAGGLAAKRWLLEHEHRHAAWSLR